eukprot:364100-Chlamydomonas_euryale.AAC.15
MACAEVQTVLHLWQMWDVPMNMHVCFASPAILSSCLKHHLAALTFLYKIVKPMMHTTTLANM